MTASGTTRVLATLLMCIRLLAVAVALVVAVVAVRGGPVIIEALLSMPRDIEAVITASSKREVAATETAPDAGPTGRKQLRRRLQEVLSHHAILTVRFMRSTVSGDPGFVDAANAVVVRSAEDLRTALEPTIGHADATAFADGWAAHTPLLFSYAAALRDGDDTRREEARARLQTYVDQQAALTAKVTDGQADATMAATSLRMQIDLLLYQIDAYARGDHDQAYELEREAYAHMYPFAAVLAAAATGHGPRIVRTSATEELRTDMSLLLAEHGELSVDALRAGVAGGDDFAAATAALHANTGELSDVVDALIGGRQSRRLNQLLTKRIDLLMRYAVAVADHEPSTRRKVRDRLQTLSGRMGRTAQKATGDQLDAVVVADALRSHDVLLLDQLEAYADGDHGSAHDLSYTAHHRIHDLAHTLAKAFLRTARDGMPLGGAATGGGGTAPSGP